MPVSNRLEIRRVVPSYLVAADHPAPDAVGERLDAALGGVGRELGAALAPLAAGDADGIWLLRQVELDLALDVVLPAERLTRNWAHGLASAIARKLDAAADGVVFLPTTPRISPASSSISQQATPGASGTTNASLG
jgi:hypothetical protein